MGQGYIAREDESLGSLRIFFLFDISFFVFFAGFLVIIAILVLVIGVLGIEVAYLDSWLVGKPLRSNVRNV